MPTTIKNLQVLYVGTLKNALWDLYIRSLLYLNNNGHVIKYLCLYLLSLGINLLLLFINSYPEFSNEFLQNYLTLMESSSNNMNSQG